MVQIHLEVPGSKRKLYVSITCYGMQKLNCIAIYISQGTPTKFRHVQQILEFFSLHSEKIQVSSFVYLPCVEKVPRDARQTLCVFCPLMHSYSSDLRGGAATSAYIVDSNPTECSIDFLKNL